MSIFQLDKGEWSWLMYIVILMYSIDMWHEFLSKLFQQLEDAIFYSGELYVFYLFMDLVLFMGVW